MSDVSAQSASRWWSKAILIGSVLAAAFLPLGALGSRFGLWNFGTGLMLLAAGTIIAALGLVTGFAAIFAAHRRDLSRDRRAAYLGTAVCALILALMGSQFYTASSVPPIHNISTNVDDPPQFERIAALRGKNANPLEYDADEIAPLQQRAYPWVESLESTLPADEALERAVITLQNMGLEIVSVDKQAGLVEATDTTFWFGFKDDVVVRVGATPQGSVVDMRSVSRVGVSDLGKNAQRIGEFMDSFRGA